MIKRRKFDKRKVGLPPGSLHYSGTASKEHPFSIKVYAYDAEELIIDEAQSFSALKAFENGGKVRWINVNGVHRVEEVDSICQFFKVHHLVVEDILHTDQRPKWDESEGQIYVVLKMLGFDEASNSVKGEQISLLLGPDFVLSFQEWEGDVFDGIRQRITANKGRIRKQGADYLLYCLVDSIVDHYFLVIERISEQLDELEEDLLENPGEHLLHELYRTKRELLHIRKAVWPLREVISRLEKDDLALVKKGTKIYLRDVYDHIIHVIDTVETYRDVLSSMVDLYQSSISNKINAVMKVLTIISTIFIPLTFIVGVYGMNFENMPELKWQYGYFGVMGFMLAISIWMVFLFKRRKWL